MTMVGLKTAVAAVVTVVLLGSLSGCGKDDIREYCTEVKAYQQVVPGNRIQVPDDLDPLDELKEITVPKAETPPRPEGAKCLDSPPSVLSE